MSQFDFPRINFSGESFINPPTANNNLLFPLVIYDPIQVKVILPPRIYLSSNHLQLFKLGGLPITKKQTIKHDEKQQPYIEIEPINTKEKFALWAKTPLANSTLDKHYHDLYHLVKAKRSQKSIAGSLPASWNFYGGMEFGFRDVKVESVAILNNEKKQQLITPATSACPPEIADYLEATLTMDNDKGNSAAVMIDVLPSLAMFSQVFCDVLQLKSKNKILFKGKPGKASLRFLNLNRIINQEGVLNASGSFFTTIPVEALEGELQAPIIQLFRNYSTKKLLLKGVFIRYNLFEVQENQEPDYESLGLSANPAMATVVGTISPWYEGEMKSIGLGRQLIPQDDFMPHKKMAPFVCKTDIAQKIISLDLLSSIPEKQIKDNPAYAYETYPLGLLSLRLLENNKQEIELGQFYVNPEHFSRKHLMQTGGILDLNLQDNTMLTQERLDEGSLILYGLSNTNGADQTKEVVLMKESEFMVASDQAGMYASQGADSTEGYWSNSFKKESCKIRVFRRGKPFTGYLPMQVMEMKVTEKGATSVNLFLQTENFQDNQIINFPTDQAANAIYVFYPGTTTINLKDLILEVLRTGFFVNLRVLPRHDYGKFLDPQHPEYPTPVTFEVIYKELLQVYDFLFPISSLITPFTEEYFRRGYKFLRQRMSPNNWESATYMPTSRDLSEDQWALFTKWVETNNA